MPDAAKWSSLLHGCVLPYPALRPHCPEHGDTKPRCKPPSTVAAFLAAERPVLHASSPSCDVYKPPWACNHVACVFHQNSVLKTSQLDTFQEMYSCSMLGCNSWESWFIQLIPHHVNKLTWHSSFRELMCCQISLMKHTNLQNDSYLVSTPTIAIYIPTLPYTLGKQHPNLCINFTNPPPLWYNRMCYRLLPYAPLQSSVREA